MTQQFEPTKRQIFDQYESDLNALQKQITVLKAALDVLACRFVRYKVEYEHHSLSKIVTHYAKKLVQEALHQARENVARRKRTLHAYPFNTQKQIIH